MGESLQKRKKPHDLFQEIDQGLEDMKSQKKTVYIETSIVSYLTARPSSDLLAAAWQKATLDWWETQRDRFCLYTSDVAIEEAGKGDPDAAALRMEALVQIPILEITDSVLAFSKVLINTGTLPKKAIDDSLHIALSVVHGVDYLLTWNCRHIDNAETKPIVRNVCLVHGYKCPEICTPVELMGGN